MYSLFSTFRRRFAGLGLLSVAACAMLLAGCSDSSQKSAKSASAKPAVPVHVAKAVPEKVKVYSTFPGRIHGERSVQVVARVEGILEGRHYNEGEVVHKGDLLYTIDDRSFKAVVDQRKAQLASSKASLSQAQRNWQRVQRLFKANAISEAKRDQALSQLETAKAAVQLAKANLESARIDLEYTTVEAPITGVTSLRDVDVGTLVQTGTKLTMITKLDPVYVLFALPAGDALARRKALQHMGGETTNATRREVEIIRPGGATYPTKGEVDFTQSTIDPETGTVQLRAVVKNPKHILTPGRFVQVRLRIATLNDVIVVPSQAVGSSQKRPFVYIVSDGKAKKESVELGPEVTSGRVIRQGLSAGDQVVISGLGQLRPGAPVKIKNDDKTGGAGKDSGTDDQMAMISLHGASVGGTSGAVILASQSHSYIPEATGAHRNV